MAQGTKNDFRDQPVVELAERLLSEVAVRPQLVARRPSAARPDPFSAMALLAEPTLDVRQYLEDLASRAVESAQQAEAVSRQAHAADRKARQVLAALACCTGLGVTVGIVGLASSHNANLQLVQIGSELGALRELQRQTQTQLDELASRASEVQAALAPAPTVPVATFATPLTASMMPLLPPQPSRQLQPWPDSRPLPRHIVAAKSLPPPESGFFADLQRNIRAIFR